LHYAIADSNDVIFLMFNFLRKQFNLPEPQIVVQGPNSLHGPHRPFTGPLQNHEINHLFYLSEFHKKL
jgi:hypothetical protein